MKSAMDNFLWRKGARSYVFICWV